MDARYAIYFVPPQESELYRFGASVLGTDCYTDEVVAFPASAGSGWAEATREPRRYGFHATLKAPFRLARGTTESDLIAVVRAFAQRQPPVDAGVLQVTELGSFIALVPDRPWAVLNQLAAACVREFDRFRAPMTTEERDRRLLAPLSARQIGQVDAWGYPFVFDDFRFHMTLTGPMPDGARKAALDWLSSEFKRRPSAARLVIDQIVISREGQTSFRVIDVAGLATSCKS